MSEEKTFWFIKDNIWKWRIWSFTPLSEKQFLNEIGKKYEYISINNMQSCDLNDYPNQYHLDVAGDSFYE